MNEPLLAGPLGDALSPDLAFTFFEKKWADASWIEESAAIALILTRLRANPKTLAAMAEALHDGCVMTTTQHGSDAHETRAALILDALLGLPVKVL